MKLVPEAVERSTYVFAASAALALLLWQWRPIAEPMSWSVQSPLAVWLLDAVFWLGWAVLLISTFLINHFAVATTGYVLIGIWFEERDLMAQFGNRYRAYRGQAGMLLPRLGGQPRRDSTAK